MIYQRSIEEMRQAHGVNTHMTPRGGRAAVKEDEGGGRKQRT